MNDYTRNPDFPECGLFGLWNFKPKTETLLKKTYFSRAFPASLACYMMARNIPLIYAVCDSDLKIKMKKISVEEVFNCHTRNSAKLQFSFFRKDPYPICGYYDPWEMETIDLIVQDPFTSKPLSCLDIYLTVVPDNRTSKRAPILWGSELGIEYRATAFMILSLFRTMEQEHVPILETLEPIFGSIKKWDESTFEKGKFGETPKKLDELQKMCVPFQRPIVLQCLWRTKGQKPILERNAFDIVAWSDLALSRPMFMRIQLDRLDGISESIVKVARALWELANVKNSKKPMKEILEQIVGTRYGGKEFSLAGDKWRSFVWSPRVFRPAIKLDELKNIIDFSQFFHIVPDRQLQQSLKYMYQEGKLDKFEPEAPLDED